MASSFGERIIGAAKLDVNIYEEVEADTSAMGQAMAVVVMSSIAAGIGSLRAGGVMGLVMTTVAALIGWFIWAGLTYVIGTKMLPEPQTKSDMGELLRTIGFASSPGLLRVLGIIPILGALIGLIVSVWMLVAFVIAVRQALDYKSTGRAVAVCLIGFVVYFVIMIGISVIGGVGAGIFGAATS
jgi:hypothetical protein